jgi:hypothetical protein
MSTETLEACYRTLGLAPDARFDEIKYAYRVLVKRWHPDRFAPDTDGQRQALERFYIITSAYETLRARQVAVDATRQRVISWATRGMWYFGIGGLITIGCYVFQPAFRHAAPPLPLARLPLVLAQSVAQRESITVGSTKDVVYAVQGPPTWATNRVWEYRGSRLYFNAGRVTGWEIWPGSPLKVHLLPATPINPVPAYFTVGATKDAVLAVQGTPTRVTERLWEYGAARVSFTDNRVTRWEVWPGSPLKARLMPVEPET